MKKKGFTLIELLAVIVILAIIALIATPIILGMIENAKKEAAKDSAMGYVEAAENYFAFNNLKGETVVPTGSYKVAENNSSYKSFNEYVSLKGTRPVAGAIDVESNRVTKANLCIGGYVINYENDKYTSGERCDETFGTSFPTPTFSSVSEDWEASKNVTINFPSVPEGKGYVYQYSLNSGTSWLTANNQTTELTVDENNSQLIARVAKNNESVSSNTTVVTYIDGEGPTNVDYINRASYQTGNGITSVLQGNVDPSVSSISVDSESGMLGYQFSFDGGNTWVPEEPTMDVYYYEKDSFEFDFKIRAYDRANNYTEVDKHVLLFFKFDESTKTITGFTCYNNGGNLIIPSKIHNITVEHIDDRVFIGGGCYTNVTIPNTVKTIGESAFAYGGAGHNFIMPNSVVNIGEGAFAYNNLENLTLSNNLESIPKNAFESAGIIGDLTIPSSVTYIGESAFARGGLSGVSPDTGYYVGANLIISDSVISMGESAFQSSGAKSVTLSIKNIPNNAFSQNGFLENVTLKEGVEVIGESAFQSTKLHNITIPSSVTSIERQAFFGSELEDITFSTSHNLKNIGDGAFNYNNLKMTTLTIPEGVETIGTSDVVFGSMSNVTRINLPSTIKNISNIAFYSALFDIYINKPENSVSGAPWTFNSNNSNVHWIG